MVINVVFQAIEHTQNPAFAVTDAHRRNEENIGLWNIDSRKIAREFANLVSNVFPERRVFINFRKKSIAVKVETPSRSELLTQQAKLLVDTVKAMDIAVKVTQNGIIFHLKH